MNIGARALATALFACSALTCSCSLEGAKRSKGQEIVAKIEQFRRDHHRLPESLQDIGERDTEEGPIYYQKTSQERYIVWYGTTLGESVTYDSQLGRWD